MSVFAMFVMNMLLSYSEYMSIRDKNRNMEYLTIIVLFDF